MVKCAVMRHHWCPLCSEWGHGDSNVQQHCSCVEQFDYLGKTRVTCKSRVAHDFLTRFSEEGLSVDRATRGLAIEFHSKFCLFSDSQSVQSVCLYILSPEAGIQQLLGWNDTLRASCLFRDTL